MMIELNSTETTLYEKDYCLWLDETINHLQRHDFDALDLENLIDEVSDLSRREKRRLESLLKRLFEHLLKLKYWESERNNNKNHWKKEIRNFRQQISKELQVSPSLRPYANLVLDECYVNACKLFADESGIDLNSLPETPIANLDQLLDETWFA